MGAFGTQGIGGYQVGTINSGTGGELTATFNVPSQIGRRRSYRHTRPDGTGYPFFAYNWFYNTTATVCP